MLELQTKLVIFFTKHFFSVFCLRKWLTNYSYSHLGIWQTFFQKWTKWDCHFKQLKQLTTAFVVNDKIWALNWKPEFWKSCIDTCHHDLDSFPIPKEFLEEISGDIHKCDHMVFYQELCINIQKMSITQWISIFQKTNIWCYKIIYAKTQLKCKEY